MESLLLPSQVIKKLVFTTWVLSNLASLSIHSGVTSMEVKFLVDFGGSPLSK